MNSILREKIIQGCDLKIALKGPNVGVSFYAFFKNKNDDPELLMEAAQWWILENKLDHFEKATKIKALANLNNTIGMNSKKYIVSGKGLPSWANPISHAVVADNMCFVSGQLSVNGEGNYVEGSIEEEAELSFSNLFAAINNAGFLKEDIVFVDIAFNNLKDLPKVNQLFMDLFPEKQRPARTIYQAQALPFGGKVKVTCTAVKPK